jgi:3-hydroxyisobutyrate dehydrogenase-like beta-hydroxyacid dehydrogenase
VKVAIIGAGIMGGGMARRLLREGHEVAVYDKADAAVAALEELGARRTGSPRDAAHDREFVLLSLPRDSNVRDAMRGPDGVIAGISAGTIVIDTSTVSPQTVRELAPEVAAAGGHMLDAPVVTSQLPDRRPIPDDLGDLPSTGQQAAAAGNLGFFIGGDADVAESAAPLFDVLGLEHHRMGDLGAGVVLKLINNAVVGAEVVLLSELMVVARRAGLDLATVVDVLGSSSANSFVLHSHIERYTVPGVFPDGQFPVDYMVKDLQLAVDAAQDEGVDLTVAGAALARFRQASEAGLGAVYNAAVIRSIDPEAS